MLSDEHPRADTSIEKLATLPVLHPSFPMRPLPRQFGGLNDAAAAVVVTADDYARTNGLEVLGPRCGLGIVGIDLSELGWPRR